jgi:hypothetical protein
MMTFGCLWVISISIEALIIGIKLGVTSMILSFSITSLVTWASLNSLSRAGLLLGVICKSLLFWNRWTGFLLLLSGPAVSPTQLCFLWPELLLTICHVKFRLVLVSLEPTFSDSRTIGSDTPIALSRFLMLGPSLLDVRIVPMLSVLSLRF